MGASLTGVILAGGENSRMKTHKALLEVGGRTIIERQLAALGEVLENIIVVSRSPERFSGLGVRIVPDDDEFKDVRGPLTGVYTGLKRAGGDCLVVACDMPFIEPGLVASLDGLRSGHDLVIPVVGGYAEPLLGVYPACSAAFMRDTLLRGGRRVQDIFGYMDVLYVDEDELRRFDPGLRSFVNINTPADLAKAREQFREAGCAGHCGVLG